MISQRTYGINSYSTGLIPTFSEFSLPRRNVLPRSGLSSGITRKERYTRCLSSPSLPLSKVSSSPSSSSHYLCTPTRQTRERWWRTPTPSLCTPEQLLNIIKEPNGYYALPSDPYNEVYPGIILGDAPTAMCTALLKRLGVSHVLNAAHGKERRAGLVNTSPSFYSYSGIRFLGVEAFDNIVFRLYPYFDVSAQFIEDAISKGGKVLVHCRAGISRSATLVCAFLMLKRNMSAQEAIRTVRAQRAIIPNDGFLRQLCDLDDKLRGIK